MIEDGRRLPPGTTLHADVCIVGGGAAGITIARELAGTGLSSIVLVGGGRRERAADRDLYRGFVDAGCGHEPLEENRVRGWGGSTAAWGGRCVPLDPIDFEDRPHVAFSGWPITWEDLQPFYRWANTVCQAGRFAYDVGSTFPGRHPEMIPGFDGPDVVSDRLERWSPPTHFGRTYGRELRADRDTLVLLNVHALGLDLSGTGDRVWRLRGAGGPGRGISVVASDYVLACGGLENARLLLASNDVEPAGIGNRRGLVGRFYMAHLDGVLATVELRSIEGLAFDFERDAEGVYCRRRFWVTPEAQARHRMGNGIGFFHRPNIADAGHRNAVFSATFLAKEYRSGAMALRRAGWPGARAALGPGRAVRSEHWRVVAGDLPAAVPQAAHLFQRRWLARRRLPTILGGPSADRLELYYQTEHHPNPDSRVELDDRRDSLGMPRLRIHPAFAQSDFDTVDRFHQLVGAALADSGTGRLSYVSDVPSHLAQRVAQFNSAAHHLGTTRMSKTPDDGVVDRHQRVHSVANLYVTGGSVFPTSGHANPTLTIVALALRLADHLVGRDSARPAASSDGAPGSRRRPGMAGINFGGARSR